MRTVFLSLVLVSALIAPASAITLTRVVITNTTDACIYYTTQEAGVKGTQSFGPIGPHRSEDYIWHTNQSPPRNYYLEWTAHDCGTHRVLYKDFKIIDSGRIHHLTVRVVGSRYVAAQSP
jgi:hypothetical protein